MSATVLDWPAAITYWTGVILDLFFFFNLFLVIPTPIMGLELTIPEIKSRMLFLLSQPGAPVCYILN